MPGLGYLSDEQMQRLRLAGVADTLGGRFVIVREAGAGGMGRVYEAIDPLTHRRLAVKVMARRGEAEMARFAAEAQILETLSHPAIVAYVAHGTTPEGDPYLAMEWIEGESLAVRLRRGTLEIAAAVALARRLAAGLAAAHARRVVHRDLKPSNVMLVGRDPEAAVIVDFGVARVRAPAAPQLTRTGQVVGTPGYMAPEQARGEPRLDGAVDRFALGCLLHEALTGQPAFDGGDLAAFVGQVQLDEPRPISALRPAVPRRLESLIGWLLAKDPAERPAGTELVDELAVIGEALAAGDRGFLDGAITRPLRSSQAVDTVPDATRAERPGGAGVGAGAPRERDFSGRAFGEFVAREPLGSGGFGTVYRAEQPALGREAVIKVLHSGLAASQAAVERFLREAKLASRLDHPYASHIYAFGAEPDGVRWIAMELVRGTPLDRLLAAHGPISLERLVPLIERICEVVHTAHEQGIVHRDIKPGNVMVLARAGRLLPKLLDFGIAKLDEPGADESAAAAAPRRAGEGGLDLTVPGSAMGSPLYMAPEQWADSARADARTDIYALGILCFEALTGRPPFLGAGEQEVAAAHAIQPLPPLGPDRPAALHEVLARATAKEPAERFASALELAAAIRTASGIAPEPAHVPKLAAQLHLAATAGAPRPIALALDAFDAARNAHQARDALWQLVRTSLRFVAVAALACHAHVGGGGERAALRRLRGRALADSDWLELARDLVRPFADLRDAYPLPELVDFLIGPRSAALEELLALRAEEPGGGSEEKARALLDRALPLLARLITELGFLRHYPLVVPGPARAEEWVGMRRAERARPARGGVELPAGRPVLLDADGVPVVELAPFAQVHQPAPGAQPAMFFLEGRGRRGARLVALPDAFEHEDEELWRSLDELLADESDAAQGAAAEESCPFPGLAAFTAAEAGLFVGRERESEKAINHLRVSSIVAVVGPSGAGKSSFVQAGVLPALPEGWRSVVVRPGPSPIAALTARLEAAGIDLAGADLRGEPARLGALLRAAGRSGTVVLVVDQLEELFTVCRDAAERTAYAEALVGALRSADDPVRLIVTLRDDFLVRAESLPALSGWLTPALHLLTTPAGPELRRILVEPLRRAGYELDDPSLPDEMVAEVDGVPGALALLSFTASTMWELRDRRFRQLGRKAYDSLGGVGGALAGHAEATLKAMAPEERRLVREVFHHAVTAEGTRAVLSRDELSQLLGGGPHAESVIEKLVVARLLSVGSESEADRIEITHEALLEAWPRLRTWRQEQAEGSRLRDQLRAASRQWHDRARPSGLLWRGEALDELRIWRARHGGPLTGTEEAFAGASLAEAARERRRRRILFAVAFAVLSVAVVGLVLLNARVRGEEAKALGRLRSQYEDQGRRLSLDDDPLQALVYLDRAGALGARGPAHDFLVARALRATGGELLTLEHGDLVLRARFSRDGSRLVTAGADGEARVWNASDGRLLARLRHQGAVVRADFSPDGSAIVTASDRDAAGLWDASGRLRGWLRGHAGGVQEARFSPDGARVVTLAGDMSVRLWDARDGQLVATLRPPGTAADLAPGSPCAFSPDGRLVAAGDDAGEVRVWQVDGGHLVRALAAGGGRVASTRFSSDGRLLIAAGQAGVASVWEVASGARVATLGHRGAINAAEPSPDGTAVVTASADHTAILWSVRTGQPIATFAGHSAAVSAVAFSADGGRVATASDDGTAVLWDVATGRPLARWYGHRSSIVDVAFDGAGQRVVTASSDGSAIVWSAEPHERALALRSEDTIEWAEFSSDGDRLVTAGHDGTARIWEARSGRQLLKLGGGGAVMYAARFSPDGLRVATTDDASIDLWDARTGRLERRLAGHTSRVNQVAWHPDGSRLVSASNDGTARVWRAGDGAAVLTIGASGTPPLFSADFAPSGDRIAVTREGGEVTLVDATSGTIEATHRDPDTRFTVAFDRSGERALSCTFLLTAKLWRVSDGARLTELIGHSGDLTSCGLRPDGALAITGSADGTARIWDASTGSLLAILRNPHGPVSAARFSPDGSRAVVAGAGGAMIWEMARFTGGQAGLERLVRCRVPYALDRELVTSRPRDRSACRP